MNRGQGVLAVYTYADSALETIRKLKAAGYRNLRVFSPFPNHEFEEELKEKESPVRFFTLTGGTIGAICGLGITIITSLDWALRVSAKPIASLPPYMIIVFELTVLLGALATLLGLLINSRLRRNAPLAVYDPRFSEDKFGILGECERDDIRKVEEILKSNWADEVRFEGV